MISIIIPTFNEEANIGFTLEYLQTGIDKANISEIIIADKNSTDETVHIGRKFGAKVILVNGRTRASQLNEGAAVADSPILFFLHADTIPPRGFTKDILKAIDKSIYAGCFRLSFNFDHWFLSANAWFTRFNFNAVRFGDQGLFVAKRVFENCGGFREDLFLMEDQEIVSRLKKNTRFTIIDKYVRTSARKYLANGIYKTQLTFFVIWLLFHLGASQETLLKIYRILKR